MASMLRRTVGRGSGLAAIRGGNRALLLPIAAARKDSDLGHGSLLADLHWVLRHGGTCRAPRTPRSTLNPPYCAPPAWRRLWRCSRTRIGPDTRLRANQRTQFGKSIGRFQAIQNQISVLAERTWASRMAAQIACQGEGWMPRPLMAAIGKTRCSEQMRYSFADIAHAVHGAIGITEEYDLQLYTRCLREWAQRWRHGSLVGGPDRRAVAAHRRESAIDFIQTSLAAMPAFTNLGGSQCRA